MFSTGTKRNFSCASLGTSMRSFSFSLGMITVSKPPASPRDFFFETSDRKHQSSQGNFSCHSDVRADTSIGEKRRKGGEHRNAGRGSVLGNSSRRNVHVNVGILEGVGIDAQRFRPGSQKTEGGLSRLFHHVADLAREGNATFAWITNCLDVQHLAARRSIGKPGDHAGRIRLSVPLADVARRAQEHRHHLRGDHHLLLLSTSDLCSYPTANSPNLALELTHARLVRVIADHASEG